MSNYVHFSGEENEKEFLEKCIKQWELTSSSGVPEIVKMMQIATVFREMKCRIQEI